MSAIPAMETVGRPLRIAPVIGAVLLGVFSVGLLFVPLEASARKRHPHYDANHVRWREGETCAFSLQWAGEISLWGRIIHPGGEGGGGEILDIREIYDPQHQNRVIGVIYVTSHGNKIYQVNPLFPQADRVRLQILDNAITAPWAGHFEYDPKVVKYPERECQPNHLGNIGHHRYVLYDTLRSIYQAGADSVPTGEFSAKALTTPFLDEEQDYGKW